MRKDVMWEVDVGYPLPKTDDIRSFALQLRTLDSVLEEVAGGECVSSGCGFGYRDMQFWVDSEDAAKLAAERIREVLVKRGVPTAPVGQYEEGKAYVSYYEVEDADTVEDEE